MLRNELQMFRNSIFRPTLPQESSVLGDLLVQFAESWSMDAFLGIRHLVKQKRDDDLVIRTVDSEHLALIAGEYMLKYDLPASFMLNFPEYVPYVFLTYTTSHNVFLGHFQQTFREFASYGILAVLLESNLDQEYLKQCVVECSGTVCGLEAAIGAYEGFRDPSFLAKVAHCIPADRTDLILDVAKMVETYAFDLTAHQAHCLLQIVAVQDCKPSFISFLATKLETSAVRELKGVADIVIAIYSRHGVLLAEMVCELVDSPQKLHLLARHSEVCDSAACLLCLQLVACRASVSRDAGNSNHICSGFFFHLLDQEYSDDAITHFLCRDEPHDPVAKVVLFEEVLCFIKYAREKDVLERHVSGIFRRRNCALVRKALDALSSKPFFSKLWEIENLSPLHTKTIELRITSLCSDDLMLKHYADTFIGYAIYRENVSALLAIDSFSVAVHHADMSHALLQRYLAAKGIDEGFIRANLHRYMETILGVVARRKQTVQDATLLLPCFSTPFRNLAFRCVARPELHKITQDATAAMRCKLDDREVQIVLEYLKNVGCCDILALVAKKYGMMLVKDDRTQSLDTSSRSVDGCQKMLQKALRKCVPELHRDPSECSAIRRFIDALKTGTRDVLVLQSVVLGGKELSHELGFRIATLIRKKGDLASAATVLSVLINRLGAHATAFYLASILSCSIDAEFGRRVMVFVELLVPHLEVVDAEAFGLIRQNLRHARPNILEHVFARLDMQDIRTCLIDLATDLTLEGAGFVYKGVVQNVQGDATQGSFLAHTGLELIGEKDDVVKIVGLRLFGRAIRGETEHVADTQHAPWDRIVALLGSKNDPVVKEVLRTLHGAKVSPILSEVLYDMLLRRGATDDIARLCLELIDVDALSKPCLDKLFDTFHVDLDAFLAIMPRLRRKGYELTTEMVTELVDALARSFYARRDAIMQLVSNSVTASHIDAILDVIVVDNPRSQLVLLSLLDKIVFKVDMGMFLRLCVVIPKDKKLAVRTLRFIENREGTWSIPAKWMVRRLDRLMIWVYPLKMADRSYYAQVWQRMRAKDPDTCAAVGQYYKGRGPEFDFM